MSKPAFLRVGAFHVLTLLPAALLALFPMPLLASPVVALAFSPDGGALVSNGDRQIDIRSPKDAVVQRRVTCDLPKITSLAFAPGGKVLAVAGGEPGVRGEVRLLAWPDGKEFARLGGSADLVTCVAFNPDGTRLGAASADHKTRVWSFSESTEPALRFTLTGHAGPVLAIAFSPSGETVATASTDRSLKVWSATDGKLIRSLGHHTEAIHAIAFRPRPAGDATPVTCATASADRTVRIWQSEIGRMVRIVRGHEEPAFALAWSADSTALFSAGKEGILRRIDGGSDAILSQNRIHEDWVYALALSPDGTTLASGDWAGNVRLIRTDNGPR